MINCILCDALHICTQCSAGFYLDTLKTGCHSDCLTEDTNGNYFLKFKK